MSWVTRAGRERLWSVQAGTAAAPDSETVSKAAFATLHYLARQACKVTHFREAVAHRQKELMKMTVGGHSDTPMVNRKFARDFRRMLILKCRLLKIRYGFKCKDA